MVTLPINTKFEQLIDTLKNNAIEAEVKRKADEKKADTKFARDVAKLEAQESKLRGQEEKDKQKLKNDYEKLKQETQKILKDKKKSEQEKEEAKANLEQTRKQLGEEQKEITRQRQRLEKERQEDLAELRRAQSEELRTRKETAKKEAITSAEKKELDTKKAALDKLKEEAIGKGLNPEEDAEIKKATIEIRKEEFKLRTEGLEGTKLMSANLEELANDLKDKGLDPEKNEQYQKESLKLAKATLNDRLKNAESKSERRSILKEQKAKDKKALTLMQLQEARFSEFGETLRNAIPTTEKIAGGIFGFLGKAALITLLFALPRILNSQFAKDTVDYLERSGDSIINGFKAIGKFFLAIGKAVLNLVAIVGDFATGDTEAGMTKLKDTFKSIFDPNDPNSLVSGLTVAVGLLALVKVGRLISVLGLLTAGIGKIITKGEKGLKDNKIVDTTTTKTDPKTSKVIGQVKGQNVVKGPGGKMFFADESGKRIQGGKALTDKELKKMKFTEGQGPIKKLEKFGKLKKLLKFAKRIPVLGYILSLGTVATTLMNDQMSVKEKSKVIGGELGGLAGAGLGALALSFIPGIGTAIGGLAGYFGGKYLFTKLFEFLLGDENALEEVKKESQKALEGGEPSAEVMQNAQGLMDSKAKQQARYQSFKKNPAEKVIPAGKITGLQGGSYGDAIMDNASAAANMGLAQVGGEVMNNTNVFDQKTINNSSSYHMTEGTSSGDTTTASILFVGS